jgi:aminoglycoside/choline kinase family phosphotransferase
LEPAAVLVNGKNTRIPSGDNSARKATSQRKDQSVHTCEQEQDHTFEIDLGPATAICPCYPAQVADERSVTFGVAEDKLQLMVRTKLWFARRIDLVDDKGNRAPQVAANDCDE